MIKAVVFDMDGTLADNEMLHKEARDSVLVSLGLSPEELSDKAIGRAKREYYKEVVLENNLDTDGDKLTKQEFTKLIEIYKQVNLQPQDGLIDLLEYLTNKGVKLAVASSSDKFYILETLKILGLEKYFSVVAGGDEVERAKPAPDVYLKAINELGVLPQQAIAVEDSNTGARAAKQANIPCIGLATETGLLHQNFSSCTHVVTHLSQIKDLI